MSGTTLATPEFKSTLDDIINSFNHSALLAWSNVYGDAYNSITKYKLTHEELLDNTSGMTFAVQLMPNATRDDYEYTFIGNESCLYPLLRKTLCNISEKTPLSDEERKITTARDVIDLFVSKFGENEGYERYMSTLRYILMHEACHVWLAHQSRTEELLRQMGKSVYDENGKVTQDQFVMYAMRVANIIQDAFINVGLDSLKEHEVKKMESSLKSFLVNLDSFDAKVGSTEFSEKYGYLYKYDGSLIDGVVRLPQLIEFLEETFSKCKLTDVQTEVKNRMMKALHDNRLFDYIETDILGFVLSVLKDNPQAIPKSQMVRIMIGGSGSGMSGQSQSQSQGQGQSQGQSGQGGGQGSASSDGTDGDSQGQKRSKNVPGGEIRGEKMSGDQSGQGSPQSGQQGQSGGQGQEVYGIADENGNIEVIVSPGLTGEAAKKSGEKLENAGKSMSSTLQGMEANSFSDSENDGHDGRGFGSVFGRILEAMQKVEFKWEEALSAFVKSLPGLRDEKSWARKYIPYHRVGIRYPGEFTRRKPEDEYAVMLMIDTSGSMGSDQIKKMLGSILSAVGTKIQRLYVVFHDYDVTRVDQSVDMSTLQKHRKIFDKKFLEKYGVLKLQLGRDDTHRAEKMLSEVINEIAKNVAQGGTSHCVPLETLGDSGAFNAIKERLSGLLMYTDCGSDLQHVPDILDRYAIERKVNLKDNQVRIINSERGTTYTHARYDVIDMEKLVESEKKTGQKKGMSV